MKAIKIIAISIGTIIASITVIPILNTVKFSRKLWEFDLFGSRFIIKHRYSRKEYNDVLKKYKLK